MFRLRNIFPILLFLLTIPQNYLPQEIHNFELSFKKKQLPFGLALLVPKEQPTVSLVLSGGGSRALAHIGVLEAIEEFDIPIDQIVGTSMGSVIGGLYSLGNNVSELDSIIKSIKWDEMFSLTSSDRRNLFVDQKITEDKALLTIRLNGFKPIVPQSINTGKKIANLFTSLSFSSPINNFNSFDNLLYKFRAVATDLITGEKIILDSGSISEAMRASSSISFLLPPVHKDSLILVDGGLIDNLPIASALQLQPDFIIASDATSALRNKEELNYPWEIADQIVSIPSKKVWEKNKKFADVLITHNLKIRNNNFEDISKTIVAGYNNAVPKLSGIKEKISNLFLKKLKKNDYVFRKISLPLNANSLDSIIYKKFFTKDSIKKSEILFALYQQFSSGNFEKISAKVIADSTTTYIKSNYKLNPLITSINIKGIKLFQIDSIYNIFTPLYNYPYNPKKLLPKLLVLIKKYRKKGNITSTIDTVKFHKKNGELVITVDEGKINDIVLEGNNHTLDAVVKREFSTIPGDFLLKEDLDEGLQNLSSTNLFNSVNVNLISDSTGKKIKLSLEEKLPNVLRLGLKIDNEYHTQTAIDIRNENLFGTGSELGLSIAGGTRNISYVLEHKTNRIFNTYLTYKAQAFYKFRDINIYDYDDNQNENRFSRSLVGEYSQIFYGGFLGIGAHLKKLGTVTAEGKYQVDEIKGISSFPEDKSYKVNISSLKIRLQIDSQNKYPYPTKGIHINTYYETAQKILGGDISFAKFSFNYESYFTFNNSHTIKPRLIFGFADETLPLSEQFSFGGQQNFWGYRDYEFRGRQILIGSLEYRFKLPFKIYVDTYFKVRYDLGSTWIKQEQIKFEDLKHGIGFSLSFDTPIGPAEFSIGRSLLLEETSPKTIINRGPLFFYFTIGYYY